MSDLVKAVQPGQLSERCPPRGSPPPGWGGVNREAREALTSSSWPGVGSQWVARANAMGIQVSRASLSLLHRGRPGCVSVSGSQVFWQAMMSVCQAARYSGRL